MSAPMRRPGDDSWPLLGMSDALPPEVRMRRLGEAAERAHAQDRAAEAARLAATIAGTPRPTPAPTPRPTPNPNAVASTPSTPAPAKTSKPETAPSRAVEAPSRPWRGLRVSLSGSEAARRSQDRTAPLGRKFPATEGLTVEELRTIAQGVMSGDIGLIRHDDEDHHDDHAGDRQTFSRQPFDYRPTTSKTTRTTASPRGIRGLRRRV